MVACLPSGPFPVLALVLALGLMKSGWEELFKKPRCRPGVGEAREGHDCCVPYGAAAVTIASASAAQAAAAIARGRTFELASVLLLAHHRSLQWQRHVQRVIG